MSERVLPRFYFAYCEAAFDAKYIHNFQIRWGKALDHSATAAPLQPSSSQELPKHATKATAPADPVTQASSFFIVTPLSPHSPLVQGALNRLHVDRAPSAGAREDPSRVANPSNKGPECV